MGLVQNLASANAGVTAFSTASAKQQNARIIQQNDEIIELLKSIARSSDFLAQMEQSRRGR